MTLKEFNNGLTDRVQDEVDMMHPSSEDLGKGLTCAILAHLPVMILCVYNFTSIFSLVAWGVICGIIGVRMSFYYANKRVMERRNNRLDSFKYRKYPKEGVK